MKQKKRLSVVGALFLLALTLSIWVEPTAQAAPLLALANDNLANAEDVTAGPFAVVRNVDLSAADTNLETNEADCTTHDQDTASIWYKITPAGNGKLTTSVAPGGNDDVNIGIFTGATHPLTPVICVDAGTAGGGVVFKTLALRPGVSLQRPVAVR